MMAKLCEAVIAQIITLSRQPISKTRLFKLSFIVRNKLPADYRTHFPDFLPYRYGPYSFSLQKELERMVRLGIVEEVVSNEKKTCYYRLGVRAAVSLPEQVQETVGCVVRDFQSLNDDALMQFVYRSYPSFTILSEVRRMKPRPVARPAVYTIGYEGTSIEGFLRKLIFTGIQSVLDIRHVAFSRRYGFSGGTLRNLCLRVDIEYNHVPELGIQPAVRRSRLTTEQSRQELLDEYERYVVPNKTELLEKLAERVKTKPSALLCFEADPNRCHRGRVARWLSCYTGLDIIHLEVRREGEDADSDYRKELSTPL